MSPGARLVTWVLSTITVVVLLFGYHTSTAGALQVGSSILGAPPPGTTSGGSGGSGSGAGTAGSGGSGGSTSTASGTVTGPTVQTRWGPVQVSITIKGGKITNVGVPVYPNNNSLDMQINSYALPILVQETLDQQSANISMISGATVTSGGYLQSLQGAIDQAGL